MKSQTRDRGQAVILEAFGARCVAYSSNKGQLGVKLGGGSYPELRVLLGSHGMAGAGAKTLSVPLTALYGGLCWQPDLMSILLPRELRLVSASPSLSLPAPLSLCQRRSTWCQAAAQAEQICRCAGEKAPALGQRTKFIVTWRFVSGQKAGCSVSKGCGQGGLLEHHRGRGRGMMQGEDAGYTGTSE